jgi:hypothetical protein
MKGVVHPVLNRGAAPRPHGLTPPSPEGRGQKFLPPAKQGMALDGSIKDYSTHASAFLLDRPLQRENKQAHHRRVSG